MWQGDNQSQPTFTSLYRAVCGQLLQVSTHHTIPVNVFPLSSEEFHWFWLYLHFRDRLCGEECYWWMQFVGAVEFIKTMEWIYTECGERGDIKKWSWAGVIERSTWLLSVTEYTEEEKRECLRLTKMFIRGLLISELIRIWKCCHKLKRQTRWFLSPVVTPKKSNAKLNYDHKEWPGYGLWWKSTVYDLWDL